MTEPDAARLLALVEHWRERERTLCRRADEAPTPQYGRQLADRAECYARCADELAVALRRLPPQVLEEKEDMSRGDKGTLSEGLDLPHRKQGVISE